MVPMMVFIGPGNKRDMMNLAQRARLADAPFFFDPGQSLNIWEGDELRDVVSGALCFISNDYELALFLRMTGWEIENLYDAVKVVITTNGSEGATIDIGGDRLLIPAIPVHKVLDPTGAGDAFRAGVLKARAMDLPWNIACRMGSTVASFSLEHYGTQEHRFSWEQFCERYSSAYGPLRVLFGPRCGSAMASCARLPITVTRQADTIKTGLSASSLRSFPVGTERFTWS